MDAGRNAIAPGEGEARPYARMLVSNRLCGVRGAGQEPTAEERRHRHRLDVDEDDFGERAAHTRAPLVQRSGEGGTAVDVRCRGYGDVRSSTASSGYATIARRVGIGPAPGVT